MVRLLPRAGREGRDLRQYRGGGARAGTETNNGGAFCHTKGFGLTNGTIRIKHDIRYTLLVSIWGDDATTTEFRGGGVFWKALKLYQGDERARILFTVHARNVDQIPAVAQIIADHGIRFSFNYFSPTESYKKKLASHAPNDSEFFRINSQDDNFILDKRSLPRVRDAINTAIDRHKGQIIHTHAFNEVITRPGGIYDIDPETGLATNCNGAISVGTRPTASISSQARPNAVHRTWIVVPAG